MTEMLVYGTLRKGQYNHKRITIIFGEDSMKFLQTEEVPGFALYDLGYYPAASPSNTKDKILCDRVMVSDEAAHYINTMERSAGYVTRQVNGARLYVMEDPAVEQFRIIDSGDWLQK